MIKSSRGNEEDTAVFTFGRFNPPTIGHGKLFDALSEAAGSSKYFIYISQSIDDTENPLDYATKIEWMRKMFPKHAHSIVCNPNIRTMFDTAVWLYNSGVRKVTMIVGSDRVEDFETALQAYNGKRSKHGYYAFSEFRIEQIARERYPEDISATKMRDAAACNNFAVFQTGLPKGFDGRGLFNDVRKGLGLA